MMNIIGKTVLSKARNSQEKCLVFGVKKSMGEVLQKSGFKNLTKVNNGIDFHQSMIVF